MNEAPERVDRIDEPAGPRPPRKWATVAAFWTLQTAFVFLFFPLVELITNVPVGSWPGGLATAASLDLKRYFTDSEYMTVAGLYAIVITCLQAGFLTPITRPRVRSDPRPGIGRLLVCGMAVGVLAALLAVGLLLLLDILHLLDPGLKEWNLIMVVPVITLVVGLCAAAVMKEKFRNGIPIAVSLTFVVFLAGLLLLGAVLVVLSAADLIHRHFRNDTELPPWISIVMCAGAPMLGWIVATPLVIAFAKRGHPELQVSRMANRLFMGTVVEAVLTIPIDVMVRRRSFCYCSEGTFWALIIFGSVGLITLGPAIYLLPIGKRRKRLLEGRCPACGYDMHATPGAERCPECGSGWRAG